MLLPGGRRRVRVLGALLVYASIVGWGVGWGLGGALQMSAAGRPRYGGTLRLGFYQTAETYDPALATTLPERLLARTLYETLVTLDGRQGDDQQRDDREGRTGAATPRLAAAWRAELGASDGSFNCAPASGSTMERP